MRRLLTKTGLPLRPPALRSIHTGTMTMMERDINVLIRKDAGEMTWKRLRDAIFGHTTRGPGSAPKVYEQREVAFAPELSEDEVITHQEDEVPKYQSLQTVDVPEQSPVLVPPYPPRPVSKEMVLTGITVGKGTRKAARAVVTVRPGTGKVIVNGRTALNYFPHIYWRTLMLEPLIATETVGRFDIIASVRGGGVSGQAQAIRHGLAKALAARDPELRLVLRAGRFLQTDRRVKERKHTGRRGARKLQQWVKR